MNLRESRISLTACVGADGVRIFFKFINKGMSRKEGVYRGSICLAI